MAPHEYLILLEEPVGPADHLRGPEDALVTLVEYGDFECGYCADAYPVVKALLARFPGEVRFVFRHFPRSRHLPHAFRAAQLAEAAADQGRFWEMHDRLFEQPDARSEEALLAIAEEVGLDLDRVETSIASGLPRRRIADHEARAAHVVIGTPTFFVNGVRHDDARDEETLAAAIKHALKSERQHGPSSSAHAVVAPQSYRTTVRVGSHEVVVDEPPRWGGTDTGPSPIDLLVAAVASCTVMTMQFAARRRGWQVEGLEVDVRTESRDASYHIHCTLTLPPGLTDEQTKVLVRAAERCPTARVLAGEIVITHALAGALAEPKEFG